MFILVDETKTRLFMLQKSKLNLKKDNSFILRKRDKLISGYEGGAVVGVESGLGHMIVTEENLLLMNTSLKNFIDL